MRILIPSMSRSETIQTHHLVPTAEVCVPESQKADYVKTLGKDRVITHPDKIKGLTPKLNWMLNNLTDDECLVFLDDDLVKLRRCFEGKGSPNIEITEPEIVREIIYQTFVLARDCEAKLFGWAPDATAVMYYDGLDPFSLTGWLNGCAIGFVNGHELHYDEKIVAKNDYDICLMNAYLHRIRFANMMYAFDQRETFTGAGGQSAHRTSETELRDVAILRQKYGSAIKTGGKNAYRQRDYAGVQKITLNLPY